MRQLQIPSSNTLIRSALHHNLGVLTHVEDLCAFDMIYIYHHLNPGDALELNRDHSNPFEQHRVEVYFKKFKLGYISEKSSSIISRLMDQGCILNAKVKSLSKNKYMPLSGLDIEIKAIVS